MTGSAGMVPNDRGTTVSDRPATAESPDPNSVSAVESTNGPGPGTTIASPRLATGPSVLGVVCALIAPILYFCFIAHYGVNFIYWDQWSDISMLHSALHGSLDWNMLWSQHNENRMLFANLIFIGFALTTHFNAKDVMFASAALFCASYFMFLVLYRAYARRWLGPLFTLLFSAVWFSVADFENALWSFQIAWYLIVFCFMALLCCLSWRRISVSLFAVSLLIAVVASYSSLQGLILWPIGLFVIVWRIRGGRRMFWLGGIWSIVAVTITLLYFKGFNFSAGSTGGGSVSYALHHPKEMVEYLLAAMGNVIPAQVGLGWHEALGSVVLVIAAFVFYQSCRENREERGTPLPASLILFGVLFDISIALGRVSYGVSQALSSRYTMANLLLILGMGAFLVAHPAKRSLHSRRDRRSLLGGVVVALVIGFIVLQTVVSTRYGLENGRNEESSRTIGARVVVNLNEIPADQRSSYVAAYVYPSLSAAIPLIDDARTDRLSMFSPGFASEFRRLGAPTS